jgi:hypothetical protein
MALFEDVTADIFSSRDEIRNQLVDEAKLYLQLEDVDLYKTSFLSYVINVLSILSANQIFYSSTLYREFFLTQAQIQESVHNLARWIGYTVPQATPASVDVLFQIPLGFEDPQVTFRIPADYKVYAGEAQDIEFTINTDFVIDAVIRSDTQADLTDQIDDMVSNGVTIEIINNNIVQVRNTNGFHFPVQISITQGSDRPVASFLLPFTQIRKDYTSFSIPSDLEFYQFYTKRIGNLNGQIAVTDVYVVDPDVDMTNVNSVDEFEDKFTEDQKTNFLWDQATTGVFTLTSSDESYVLSVFDNAAEITFGNGVLGAQPERGSTVSMIMSLTKGLAGNVIPGSVKTGDPIYYTTDADRVSRIVFSVTNPSSATGGADLLTISEVKKNAITNLTSKNRLVSGPDYDDFNIIVPEVPLSGTIPILKRSDLKVNEITVFSQLIYANPDNPEGQSEIVPTCNIAYPLDSTSSFFVHRGSSVSTGPDSIFETIFNMDVNIETSQADYEYLIREVDITSALESADADYNGQVFFSVPTVNFKSVTDSTSSDVTNIQVLASVNHTPTTEVTQFRAILETEWDSQTYNMITELSDQDPNQVTGFFFEYPNFLNIPKNQVQWKVRVQALIPFDLITPEDKAALGITNDPTMPSQWFTISVWTANVIIRQDLSEFMISSVTQDETTGLYTIHNVPVILTDYLNNLSNRNDFELNVLQKLINNININSKKMLTDFINIKFPCTTGLLTNMLLNPVSDQSIISRSLTRVPGEHDLVTGDDISNRSDLSPLSDGCTPQVGQMILSTFDNAIYEVAEDGLAWEFQPRPILFDTYIVNGGEGTDFLDNNWADFKNQLAQWTGSNYDSTDPDQGVRLQWNGCEWVIPVFEIPFQVKLKVVKNPLTPITSFALNQNIRTALIDHFSIKFGMDVDIDRSEILKVVRCVEGVQYAEVLEPSVDIRFKYNISELEFSQLLDYTPQLVAFTDQDIEIISVNPSA